MLKVDFLIEDIFSPPLIKGQVIVAFTVSSSFSSIVELKSLFSDFETFIEAEGESLAFSIFNFLVLLLNRLRLFILNNKLIIYIAAINKNAKIKNPSDLIFKYKERIW